MGLKDKFGGARMSVCMYIYVHFNTDYLLVLSSLWLLLVTQLTDMSFEACQ